MKNAVFTCLCTRDYLPGVLLLNRLVKKHMNFQLQVLVTDELANQFETIFLREGIVYKTLCNAVQSGYKTGDYWNNTFIKLELFAMTEYDRILYIDSDILLLGNIAPCWENEELMAVRDALFMQNNTLPGINSGVMLIKPDKAVYESLINKKDELTRLKKNIGDQDVISCVFGNSIKQLGISCNACAYLLDSYDSSVTDKLKAVHFITKNKPWSWSFPYAFIRITSYYLRGRRLTGHYSRMYYLMLRKIKHSYRI